jgi:hypothetical protein
MLFDPAESGVHEVGRHPTVPVRRSDGEDPNFMGTIIEPDGQSISTDILVDGISPQFGRSNADEAGQRTGDSGDDVDIGLIGGSDSMRLGCT